MATATKTAHVRAVKVKTVAQKALAAHNSHVAAMRLKSKNSLLRAANSVPTFNAWLGGKPSTAGRAALFFALNPTLDPRRTDVKLSVKLTVLKAYMEFKQSNAS